MLSVRHHTNCINELQSNDSVLALGVSVHLAVRLYTLINFFFKEVNAIFTTHEIRALSCSCGIDVYTVVKPYVLTLQHCLC